MQLINIIVLLQKLCLKNNADNTQIHIRILTCLTSWVYVRAVPLPVIPNSDVVAYAFQVSINEYKPFFRVIKPH